MKDGLELPIPSSARYVFSGQCVLRQLQAAYATVSRLDDGKGTEIIKLSIFQIIFPRLFNSRGSFFLITTYSKRLHMCEPTTVF